MVQRKNDRLRVAVLMGGPSSEHEVSLLGGQNVVEALDRRLFDVRPVIITREGAWRLPRRTWRLPEPGEGAHFDAHDSEHWREYAGAWEGIQALRDWSVDVAVPILHGAFGEDGTLQACLSAAAIPYVGSGMRGSALAFDKVRAKEVMAFHGIETPDFEVVAVEDLARGRAERIQGWIERFGLPLVIKNPCGGSTLEVRVVHDAGEAATAIEELAPPADRLLVEAHVAGRDLTGGVVEGRERGQPVALPIVEIRPRSGSVFSYQEKYAADGAEEICPAPIDDALASEARSTALRLHGLLGLRGISRTDMILTEDGRLSVLEVNTLPGMTERGLVPLAAARSGMDFSTLIENLVRSARL